MAIHIDDRLIDGCSNPQIIENFNRTLGIIGALADVVAQIEDSMLYRVTFDSDGGSAVPTQFVIEGDKVDEPQDPTQEGYTFAGWFNGEKEYDFDTEVTMHLELTAHWDPVEDGGDE